MKREVGEYQPQGGITSARMLGRPVIPSSVVAAKRSPILGYNHNVRYRGLVFHVQTEDSGVLSPHLFTHLFHGGVIVSTRKLVYDSGSAEDAIKALMQAQHKAVLKDLKKGAFDDKIDQYLGGTPGLLPRGEGVGEAPQTTAIAPLPKPSAAEDDIAIPTAPTIDGFDSAPFAALSSGVPETVQGSLTIPSAPPVMVQDSAPTAVPVGRARTAERISGPVRVAGSLPIVPRSGTTPPAGVSTARLSPLRQVPTTRSTPPAFAVPPMQPPPPPEGLDMPTFVDHAAAVAAALDNAKTRQDIGPPIPADFADIRSSPEIEMTLEVDDDDDDRAHPRAHRDTEVSSPTPMPSASLSDGVPRGRQDSAPPLPPPPDRRVAAALPPGKSVTRPPAVAVVSRPLTNTDSSPRERHDSDSVEVYAPPPTPDLAPADRPGQYSLRRSKPVAVPEPIQPRQERSGGVAIPAGLGRPPNRSDRIRVITPPAVEVAPPTRPTPRPTPSAASQSRPFGVSSTARPEIPAAPLRAPRTAPDTEPRARSPQPTPARLPPAVPAPTSARTNTTSPVVMTRPAVIVGAPAKQTGKVRKAREDEGRGFGQGLISEKSLDEVILAYLSEDAEEK